MQILTNNKKISTIKNSGNIDDKLVFNPLKQSTTQNPGTKTELYCGTELEKVESIQYVGVIVNY